MFPGQASGELPKGPLRSVIPRLTKEAFAFLLALYECQAKASGAGLQLTQGLALPTPLNENVSINLTPLHHLGCPKHI